MKELEQLVTKAQGGDEQAFAQLYEISYDTVHGECLKNLHNALDAEDVTQESYVLIFRRLNQLQDPSKFLGWSRRIAHNASVDYIQHHQRKAGKDDYKPPVTSDEYQGMDEIAGEDTELSPEEQAEQKMIQELLQTAMDNISPERATSLALYQQGHSYQEISEILRIPVGTVKSHVYYAKQALRKEIEKIERREGVQIHGFTLVPLAAGGVKVEMKPAGQPKGNGFISAETAVSSSESAMKEEIGKKVLSHRRKSRNGPDSAVGEDSGGRHCGSGNCRRHCPGGKPGVQNQFCHTDGNRHGRVPVSFGSGRGFCRAGTGSNTPESVPSFCQKAE